MLTSPRIIAPLMALSLAALTIASCSQQNSPTSPSSVTASFGAQPAVTEYWVTLYDEHPGEEPPPGGEPAPAPEGPEAPPPPPPPPPPPSPPGSAWVPWPPGPPPMAAPLVPVPTPPSTHFRLVPIKIDPEPVPHSGVPVSTFGCRDNRYSWYYKQILDAETSVDVIFNERENFFDGRFVSKNTESIHLVVHKPVTLNTRWCSAYPKPHYAQTRFKGRDANGEPITVSGPWVRLLAP